MLRRLKQWWNNFHLSLRMKMFLSLSSIAVVLLLSSVISLLEYRRMSTYVSGIIDDDIRNIELAHSLINAVDAYNLQILAVIGDEDLTTLPDFDQQKFVFYCDSLKTSFTGKNLVPLADSVLYAYAAYMLASLELEQVLVSDESSRNWYFERLQPFFNRLRGYIEKLSGAMYAELRQNSADFDRGFYRSIIPSTLAVTVGIILLLLLLFFLLVYYVRPLRRMLASLDAYRSFGKKYNYDFEGDDELKALNAGLQELSEENRQLRRRLKDLKDRLSAQ